MLRVDRLTKRFAGVVAVDDVSFEVDQGTLLGIMGPNGAGKTTLFAMLSGFQAPTSGSISLEGRDITRSRPHERVRMGIARVFQIVSPFPDLSVADNVRVPAIHARQYGRLPETSLPRTVARVLERVGLSSLAEEPARNLAHGDLKRLEVARALATAPRLLLLDEPFAGLGQAEVSKQVELVRSLHAEGMTIILVEHLLRVLMPLSQKLVVVDHGSVIATGTPAEVRQMPQVITAYLGEPDPDDAG